MYASTSRYWLSLVYPNLSDSLYEEFLTMVLSMYPGVRRCERAPSFDPVETHWAFPLVDVPQDFDYETHEDWLELVEQEICDKYNLPLSIWES